MDPELHGRTRSDWSYNQHATTDQKPPDSFASSLTACPLRARKDGETRGIAVTHGQSNTPSYLQDAAQRPCPEAFQAGHTVSITVARSTENTRSEAVSNTAEYPRCHTSDR